MPKTLDRIDALVDFRDQLDALAALDDPRLDKALADARRSINALIGDGTALTALDLQSTISVDQAAALLDVDRQTAYAAVKNGNLPSITVGRRRRIPSAAMRRMLALSEGA